MLFIAALLASGAAPAVLPHCRRDQLRMGVSPREGVSDFAPLSGAILSIRNLGPDCDIPALPAVVLRDLRRRPLAAMRRAPLGLNPGPAIAPIALPGGHRATFKLTWPYCPADRLCTRVGSVSANFGSFSLQAPAAASIKPAPTARFRFDQPPGRVAEGMAADLE